MQTRDLPFTALFPLLLIAFCVAWGVMGVFVAFPDQVAGIFGPVSARNPLFFLAVYAPAIAAFGLVGLYGGLRGFLARLVLWRCSWGWVLFLVLGIPALFAAGSVVKGNLWFYSPPFETLGAALAAIGFMAILGPMEEFGWRGVALPLLQRKLAPLWAGLVLGVIWGVWHLPAFYLSGTPQSSWDFMPFFAGAVAISVIVTPLFNVSRGSILLPMLYHWQLNNPLWPDAQPYDTIFFVAAAVAVVWHHRRTMFTRDGAVTKVISG